KLQRAEVGSISHSSSTSITRRSYGMALGTVCAGRMNAVSNKGSKVDTPHHAPILPAPFLKK
ncbi:MAG: hypothetical protein ACOYOF_14910, partial [Verrucomicrobiaceae bacterium]